MSIKGGAYRWLRAALERGDLAGTRAAAAELGRLNLADATSILVLMAVTRDAAYERAAVRWLSRLVAERPGIALDQLARAVTALAAMPRSASARTELTTVCAEQRIVGVVSFSQTRFRRE